MYWDIDSLVVKVSKFIHLYSVGEILLSTFRLLEWRITTATVQIDTIDVPQRIRTGLPSNNK